MKLNKRKITIVGVIIPAILVVLFFVGDYRNQNQQVVVKNEIADIKTTGAATTDIVKSDPQACTDELSSDNLDCIKNNIHSSVVDELLSQDKSNADYIKDIDKECPYYKPDGATYRECLENLLVRQDKITNAIFADIKNDLKIVINEQQESDPGFESLANDFMEYLGKLSKSWQPHIESLCRSKYAINGFGSNYAGMVNTCQLYQASILNDELLSMRYDWIGSIVEHYVTDNLQPKTEAFKLLIEKEKPLINKSGE
jgi:hypothetical protein